MSLDNALFLVNRSGVKHHVSGSSIGDKIKDGDAVLVQRGNSTFKATYSNGFNNIVNSDLILVREGGVNYHVTGANFLGLFGRGPEIEYFRHTLDSPFTLCPGTSERYSLQWKVLGDTTCVIKSPTGSVFSYSTSGNIGVSVTEIGTFEYTMEATGSNGVVEIRRISFTTRCANPTNSLSGPSNSTYGTTYKLNYTQYNHSRGDLAGSAVYDSSGSKSYTKYPSKDTTYCSVLTSYNCCGNEATTHCVKVPGFSVGPVSISGVPSQPKKKEEFTITPNYSNSSKLKNVEYKWELESGIDSGFANFNGNAAGRPGQFTSDERTPVIYVINNTHSKNGNAVSQPPGKLPDGVKLKLTVKNTDNNEESSTYVYFKTYPKA
jgi:hypothetical protein